GHTWVEGLLTHWRLTGEVRSLEAARGIADALVHLEDKAGNPRQLGWPLIALTATYDATGERRYLEAAHGYADRALALLAPTPTAGDWKMGILADGLAYTWAASGDERLRRWLVHYADALLAAPERARDPRYALPLGYLAMRTGNAQYARTALAVAHTRPRRSSSGVAARTATTVTVAWSACPAWRGLKSARTTAGPISSNRKRSGWRPGTLSRYSAPTSRARSGGSRARGISRTSSGRHAPKASSAG